MGTLKEKLEYIAETKDLIKDAIEAKGVTIESTDTFRDYADKIGEISGGGKPILHIADSKYNIIDAVSPYVNTIYIFSNTLFKDNFNSNNCTYDTSIVTNFEIVNNYFIKLTVDTTKLVTGQSFSFEINENSFKFVESSASITVPIKTTLDMFLHTSYGYSDVFNGGLDEYKRYIFDDSNNFTIDTSLAPIICIPARMNDVSNISGYTSISVDSNDYITFGNNRIYFQNRDNGTNKIQKAIYELDDGSSIVKIRQQSYAPWTGQGYDINIDYEVTFLSNGDFEIHCLTNDYTGTDGASQVVIYYNGNSYGFNEGLITFSLSDMVSGSYKSFYAQDIGYTNYIIVNEAYDIINHVNVDVVDDMTLTESLGDDSHLIYLRYHGDTVFNGDEGSGYLTSVYWEFEWRYNGIDYNTFYLHANSYIGLGAVAQNIKVGGPSGDKKIYTAQYGVYEFELNNTTLRALKIRWTGANAYGDSSVTLDYELYLFENGDAMIYLVTGTTDSSFNTFLGNSFSVSTDSCVSFYRENTEGTSWTVINEQYDISHHLI